MLGSNHRYELRRSWMGNGGLVCFVMLNPSTADDVFDDPTIRKCIGFAKRWGFSRLVVTNLFAYRATDPADLKFYYSKDKELAIGSLNDSYIMRNAHVADKIVLAWGTHPIAREREIVAQMLAAKYNLFCIRTTKNGSPVHPVREPYTDAPVMFGRWAA